MRRILWLACALGAATQAQTFTTLATFGGTNGSDPGTILEGPDGNFYGSTTTTIYRVTPKGKLTSAPSPGYFPDLSAVGLDGSLYGTTTTFGSPKGTLFKVSLGGEVRTVSQIQVAGSLTLGFAGDFYLLATVGGICYPYPDTREHVPCGSVWNVTPSGIETPLAALNQIGFTPTLIIQGRDGNLYGLTEFGGTGGLCDSQCGTAFETTTSGKLTYIHSFDYTDGAWPISSLLEGEDGNFYGTTRNGGAGDGGSCYFGCGTVFKMTPEGTVTVLHSFQPTEGNSPSNPLIQATDGNFYGVTSLGGTTNTGTIFKMTPAGEVTTLYNLAAPPSFSFPAAPALIQGTDGSFYGLTNGTIYRLTTGLGPFVKTVPSGGKAGSSVIVFGVNLHGASAVSFGGVPAAFTTVSPTEIMATVPQGAVSGKIEVTTPGGMLLSNLAFKVLP